MPMAVRVRRQRCEGCTVLTNLTFTTYVELNGKIQRVRVCEECLTQLEAGDCPPLLGVNV